MDKVYTRTGDEGMTSLHGGVRVHKTDVRIKANGAIDHLNAILGIIRTLIQTENRYFPVEYKTILLNTQFDLMKIMAIIASLPSDTIHGISHEYVQKIEKDIDTIVSETNMPAGFVIPGGGLISSFLHLARTDARNAEVSLWEVNEKYKIDPTILAYFNRLSDLFFVMSISLDEDKEYWKPSHQNL